MLAEILPNVNVLWILAALPAVAVLGHLVPYVLDSHYIRANGITGPFLARFSDAWLGWVAAHGHRSEVVHNLHKKYGKYFVVSGTAHSTFY